MSFFEVWVFVASIVIVAGAVVGTLILIIDYISDKIDSHFAKDAGFLVKTIIYFFIATGTISWALYLFTHIIGGDVIAM